jgi:hypothetical protein
MEDFADEATSPRLPFLPVRCCMPLQTVRFRATPTVSRFSCKLRLAGVPSIQTISSQLMKPQPLMGATNSASHPTPA